MYVKIIAGVVDVFPYTIGQLRKDNPNTSFPKNISKDILAAWGVYPVTKLDVPSYSIATQNVVYNSTPVLNNGIWELGCSVVDKTEDEILRFSNSLSQDNRRIRDALLKQTDWWASSDLTMTAEQTAYRQALRDITTHANWPHLEDSDWPTKP
jgi:hypothetical protein